MTNTYRAIDTTDVNLDIIMALQSHGLEFTVDYKKFGKIRTETEDGIIVTPRQEYTAYKITNREVEVNGDMINPLLFCRSSWSLWDHGYIVLCMYSIELW